MTRPGALLQLPCIKKFKGYQGRVFDGFNGREDEKRTARDAESIDTTDGQQHH
jgi:hypothetical protein